MAVTLILQSYLILDLNIQEETIVMTVKQKQKFKRLFKTPDITGDPTTQLDE